MKNLMEYKGYYGTAEYSPPDRVFHGKIALITDLVTFEGATVDELEKAFKEAVDDYLETCEILQREPKKAFKGKFNLRINPELHELASIEALRRNISLNKLVETAISHEIS